MRWLEHIFATIGVAAVVGGIFVLVVFVRVVAADGGKWKIAAIAEIARFLRVLDTKVAIVA